MATTQNLLNSNYNNYLQTDIYDMIIIDRDANEIIVADKLVNSEITQTTSVTNIQGGKGNGVIATLSSSKEIKITAETPVFNYDLLARQNGAEVIKGAGKTVKVESKIVGSQNKVTIDCDRVVGGLLKVSSKDGEIAYTGDAKELTLQDVAEGDKVRVMYEAITNENTEIIEINANNFPTGVSMYLTTYIISTEDKKVAGISYYFPSVKMSADFSSSMSAERTGNNSKYEFTVLAGNDGNLGKICLYEM